MNSHEHQHHQKNDHEHHEKRDKMDHSKHSHHKMDEHKKHDHRGHNHSKHHGHMIEDFRKRFWISLIVTIPILILSPMIQHFLGLKETFSFTGESYLLFVLSSFVFFYGGFPFLKGLIDELKKKQPGMMTLNCTRNFSRIFLQQCSCVWSKR